MLHSGAWAISAWTCLRCLSLLQDGKGFERHIIYRHTYVPYLTVPPSTCRHAFLPGTLWTDMLLTPFPTSHLHDVTFHDAVCHLPCRLASGLPCAPHLPGTAARARLQDMPALPSTTAGSARRPTPATYSYHGAATSFALTTWALRVKRAYACNSPAAAWATAIRAYRSFAGLPAAQRAVAV